MESTDKGTLQNFVIRHTARGAMVYTDEAAAYQGIPRHHEAVKHSAPEAVGTVGIVRTTRFTSTGRNAEHLGQTGAIDYRSGRFAQSDLDFTQNLDEAMDAIALARRRLRLASEGFSLSAADPDIQEPPVARYHPLADSLACAA